MGIKSSFLSMWIRWWVRASILIKLFFVELIYHHKVGRGPFLWRTRWWCGQYDMPALFERLATESNKLYFYSRLLPPFCQKRDKRTTILRSTKSSGSALSSSFSYRRKNKKEILGISIRKKWSCEVESRTNNEERPAMS